MKHNRSAVKQEPIDWRHDKVLDLSSKGHTEMEIVTTLQVCCATVHREFEQLRRASKEEYFQISRRTTALRVSEVSRRDYIYHERIMEDCSISRITRG